MELNEDYETVLKKAKGMHYAEIVAMVQTLETSAVNIYCIICGMGPVAKDYCPECWKAKGW